MTLPIGINPLTWSNDDNPALGGDIPLETCLREAAQAGYAGVELGNKFPRSAGKLGPLLRAHGLRLISGWYSAELLNRSVSEEMTAMQDHFALLEAMGCTVMVVAETSGKDFHAPLSQRPRLKEGQWPEFCEKLTAVAEQMKARGIAMAYHHHMGTVVETEEEIHRLMEGTGEAVGLLLDTGHLTFAGGDLMRVAQRHAGRINHVHCKDIRANVLKGVLAGSGSFLDAVPEGVFTVPGDGSIAYPPFLTLLRDAAYAGWLVVEAEQDPAKAHPLTYARLGYDYLSAQARAIGL